MAAGTLNLIIEQGATFRKHLRWLDENEVPVNLTGYSAYMQIRQNVDDVDPIISLGTDAGTILLGASGAIEIVIPSTSTKTMNFTNATYDLVLKSPTNDVIRLVKGSISTEKQVTRVTQIFF